MGSIRIENGVKGNLVYDVKLSSVGPANVTKSGTVYEPTNKDLLMKLHYLRGLYFFEKKAIEGLTIFDIKKSMFEWLDYFIINCGRFRRSEETGQPYIKCNDGGVRIIEARCKKTVDEWLEMKDYSLDKLLVSNEVLGPDLDFSPLVFIQLTRFRCGGMSIGLSWAHVLGDAFSASYFINIWGQVITNPHLPFIIPTPKPDTQILKNPPSFESEPLSIKRVDPVADYWVTANTCKMTTFSFQITHTQLNNILSKINGESQSYQIPSFEALSAIFWSCLAKIRTESEPRVVTVCRKGSKNSSSGNNQIIGIVKTDFSTVNVVPGELASLILNMVVNEESQIEDTIERNKLSDFIVYGSNLTFVDLEETEFYGLMLKGYRPIFVNYTMGGVGDEGVVLVIPGPSKGRIVTVVLPENQLLKLRTILEKEWCIV